MTPGADPKMLDLARFGDRDEALALATNGCPKAYTEVAKTYMGPVLTEGFLLFGSFVSRMRGLHEGIVRELAADNPHAVLPLLRAWVEVNTIGLYVARNPAYAEVVLYGPGPGRPARKSFSSLFHAVKDEVTQLGLVYKDLSDYAHFGTLGVWNAYGVDSVEDRQITWTDVPRWKSAQEFQIACAQTRELSILGLHVLDRLGRVLLHGSNSDFEEEAKPSHRDGVPGGSEGSR